MYTEFGKVCIIQVANVSHNGKRCEVFRLSVNFFRGEVL